MPPSSGSRSLWTLTASFQKVIMTLAHTLVLVLQLHAPSFTSPNSSISFVVLVRPYVHLSLRINSAVTGRLFVEMSTGKFCENRTKMSPTLHEELNTIIFLLAVRNILYDNKTNKTYCCLSMETDFCC